ncbi:Hypothetical predicted protein [Prunus dulcis]|uniref:Uncharacterized protein n=1 Tax=Prunus dulcis TaxID=3755 RepID=A0A5E4GAW5_PRUDU|nr:Hypothetical predicted protein [Prunus dulcis]
MVWRKILVEQDSKLVFDLVLQCCSILWCIVQLVQDICPLQLVVDAKPMRASDIAYSISYRYSRKKKTRMTMIKWCKLAKSNDEQHQHEEENGYNFQIPRKSHRLQETGASYVSHGTLKNKLYGVRVYTPLQWNPNSPELHVDLENNLLDKILHYMPSLTTVNEIKNYNVGCGIGILVRGVKTRAPGVIEGFGRYGHENTSSPLHLSGPMAMLIHGPRH